MTLNEWAVSRGRPPLKHFGDIEEVQPPPYTSLGMWDGDLPWITYADEPLQMTERICPGLFALRRAWPVLYFGVEIVDAIPEDMLIALRVEELSYDDFDPVRRQRRYYYQLHEQLWLDLNTYQILPEPERVVWYGIVTGELYDELWEILTAHLRSSAS